MKRKLISIIVGSAAVAGLTFGGFAVTSGSASAQTQVKASKETKDQKFVRLVHEDGVTTTLNDGQLVVLAHEINLVSFNDGAELADVIKDDSVGINSFEALQIVNDYFMTY